MLLLLVPNPVFIFRYVCISLTPRTERRQQQKLKVLPHSDTNPSTPTHPPTQCNNSTPMTRKKGSKKAAASVKVTTVGVSDPHADMDTQVLDIVPNTNTNSNNSSSSSYNQSSPHPTLPASSTPVPVPHTLQTQTQTQTHHLKSRVALPVPVGGAESMSSQVRADLAIIQTGLTLTLTLHEEKKKRSGGGSGGGGETRLPQQVRECVRECDTEEEQSSSE